MILFQILNRQWLYDPLAPLMANMFLTLIHEMLSHTVKVCMWCFMSVTRITGTSFLRNHTLTLIHYSQSFLNTCSNTREPVTLFSKTAHWLRPQSYRVLCVFSIYHTLKTKTHGPRHTSNWNSGDQRTACHDAKGLSDEWHELSHEIMFLDSMNNHYLLPQRKIRSNNCASKLTIFSSTRWSHTIQCEIWSCNDGDDEDSCLRGCESV